MGLELVLAGLAGKDDDKGEAAVVEDGIHDGTGNLDLIGTQMNFTGMRPGDRAAADGGANTGGKKIKCHESRSMCKGFAPPPAPPQM